MGAERGVEGYLHGPDATVRAMQDALVRAASARTLLLVEGISDVIALETLAARLHLDLAEAGVVVVPMGGAQAISRFVGEFGPNGADLRLTGLCDVGEERWFRRALARHGVGTADDRDQLARLGFHVCDDDLEAELIRACDPEAIEALLGAQGDLASFRTLRKQAAWRDRSFADQLHRWIRAGSTRNLRYARLLVETAATDRLPRPLVGVLHAAVGR